MAPCARCAGTRGLQEHHVVPRCEGGGGGATETLCCRCHTRQHVENGDFSRWLRERIRAMFRELGADEARATLREWGRRGGKATLERHGRAHLREIGRRGGKATAGKAGHLEKIAPLGGQAVSTRYGREHMRELGRQGAAARWRKTPVE